MAQLNGFARRIRHMRADHTYVTSSDGYVWPCWGRSSGGRRISSGNGSSAQANCLSQTHSHAGIIYGVTGVCHQTANRILWPSRTTVSGALGYEASTFFYGVYGTMGVPQLLEWEARKRRCSSVSGDRKIAAALPASIRAATEKAVAPQSAAEREFLDKIEALYAPYVKTMTIAQLAEMEPVDFLAKELDLIADYKLGADKNPEQISSLQQIQSDALKEKANLALALNNRTISGEEYASKVNDLFGTMLNQFSKTIDRETYVKLLDIKPEFTFAIVDPKIMAKMHK
jgi:hypothetical protein